MYESHYGFNAKPFSIVPNPNIMFLNEHYQNALSYMKYGLKEKVGFILLTGEIGAGKTTLVRYMLSAIKDQMDFAVIFNTHFSADQLFRLILSEFEISSDAMNKERHLELLYEFLIDRYTKGRHVLLIIDEAQNLSDDALEDIRMLSNLQTNEQILLQIMLVGQPELKKRLSSPNFRQLAQRIAVSYHLPPLTEDQTYRYVNYRIEAVGGQPDIFSPEAIKLIHDHSGGIPRTINLLCDAALVYGFADDLQHVNRDTVGLVLADHICILDPSSQAKQIEPPLKLESTDATDDLRHRMSSVERTVSALQGQVEDLSREVKNELLMKYQELLISERNRYDQLKKEYDRLFQEHTRVLVKLDGIAQPTVKDPTINPHHQPDAKIICDQKIESSPPHRPKMGWAKPHSSSRTKYADDEDFTTNPAGIQPMLWQRIANLDPMGKLSRLWAKILCRSRSFSAKVHKQYLQFKMTQIKIPSAKRWVDRINSTRRTIPHWLSWSVVCLILISFISLFFITRQPMTATVPSTKQFENRAEIKPGPMTDRKKENVTAVISEKEIDSELQKPLEITFDATREKQMLLRHIVQAGDTLSSIARAYKTNVDAIISENNLQNHLIYIGQILDIPFSGMDGSDRNPG